MDRTTGPASEPPPPARGDIYPALDGLRAAAVLMVFYHHYVNQVFPLGCGWIGVDVFFVLSGFFITGLLVREFSRDGTIDVPAFYARKRARSQAFGDDEEDELPEDHPPPAGATDQEQIEYRRRRNTLAARRSRQKKADKMATLEDDVRRLTSERDTWKTRAQTLRQLLLSHGIPCKEFED